MVTSPKIKLNTTKVLMIPWFNVKRSVSCLNGVTMSQCYQAHPTVGAFSYFPESSRLMFTPYLHNFNYTNHDLHVLEAIKISWGRTVEVSRYKYPRDLCHKIKAVCFVRFILLLYCFISLQKTIIWSTLVCQNYDQIIGLKFWTSNSWFFLIHSEKPKHLGPTIPMLEHLSALTRDKNQKNHVVRALR